MSVPQDHQQLIDELARIESEIAGLFRRLSPAQVNWQPEGGRAWSVAQCVDHLTRSNSIYLPALGEAVEKARAARRSRVRELRPNWLGRRFIASIEPPPRMKSKAPLPEMQPASTLDRDQVLADFSACQCRVVELVRSTGDLDLSGIRFRNPMLRRLPVFNVAAGLLVIAAHERRHLWQARRVLERAGFPA